MDLPKGKVLLIDEMYHNNTLNSIKNLKKIMKFKKKI